MPRKPTKYCVCTFIENQQTKGFMGMQLKRVFDNMEFADPDKDISALERLVERKEILEQTGKKSVKAYVMTEIA
jgi:hypothetical protein